MKKILSIAVKNTVGIHDNSKIVPFTELNEHLADGWSIIKTDFINSNTASCFTAIYILEKE